MKNSSLCVLYLFTVLAIFLPSHLSATPSDEVIKQGLLKNSERFLENTTSYSESELTNISKHIVHEIVGTKVTSTITDFWYYPTKALVQESGYDSIYFDEQADKILYVHAVTLDISGKQSWVSDDDLKTIDDDSYNVFSDGKRMIVNYSGLQQKGVTAIQYAIEQDLDALTGVWSSIHYPQVLSPTKSYKLDVHSDSTLAIQYTSTSDHVVCESTAVTINCVGKNIPAAQQDASVNWNDQLGHIVVSQYENWQQVIDTINTGFIKATSEKLKVANKVSELITNDMGLREKISVIHEFVSRDIRYVSMSEAGHAIVPHAVNKTLENRYGDCKDKSALLTTMLSEIGIPAYPVIVATNRSLMRHAALPSMKYFDHMIVCFQFEGEKICIDPTDSNSDWTFVSSWIQGKLALPLQVGATPQLLPRSESMWSLKQSSIIEIDQNGGQKEIQTLTFFDEYASRLRSILAGKSELERYRWVKGVYQDIVSGQAEPQSSLLGIETISNEVIINNETHYEPYFNPQEDLSNIEYDAWIQYELKEARKENTVYASQFDGIRVESEYHFRLPDLWQLESYPSTLNLSSKFGSLRRSVARINSSEFLVSTTLTMPNRLLKTSEIEAFNTVLDLYRAQSVIHYTGTLK